MSHCPHSVGQRRDAAVEDERCPLCGDGQPSRAELADLLRVAMEPLITFRDRGLDLDGMDDDHPLYDAAEELWVTISHDDFLAMVRERYDVPEGFGLRMTIESKRSYADHFAVPETVKLLFERRIPVADLRDR